MTTSEPHRLYRRWVWANGLAEAAGLGTTFLLGLAAAPVLAAWQGPVEVLGGAALAIVLGMVLEGAVVGTAQAWALPAATMVPRGAWIRATVIGAGLAWSIGMVPSTAVALLSPSPAPEGAAAEGPGPLVTIALAALLGAITGPILGAAQARVLRTVTSNAGRWLWANAVAWAVGMPLIFVGMDLVPWTSAAVPRAAAIYLVCGITGCAVGALHGRVLVRLLGAVPPR